ncbi:ChuX/HutX family heme-like substrate-binding protein [Flavihumibacter sp. CACIAM 22H1]|uniref:hemin-degrading factor n=1 Tax=Flavihumibacter sp. CACIAM 22H1 TaxID=1812911 RepID=UPI0007A8AE6E|nr:ChuX/HutX family heme-like substrate-binding protein [Flavihumibacter sp. CACIAM 22H1]KYP13301.1 MAG: hypothetical protein A1D16_06595 [Flavihumibacter sp. CACIAM 22H1]
MSTTVSGSLSNQWIQCRKEQPRLRIRDAARSMGVSEAALLASFAGTSVIRLRPEFGALLTQMPTLGKIMCLTRNEACVQERKGVFGSVDVSNKQVGLVVGEEIDLRLFFSAWAFAFAVLDDDAAGFKNSIQFFDQQGEAVLKVYLTNESDPGEFEKMIRAFATSQQEKTIQVMPPKPAPVYKDEDLDVDLFRAEWAALKDTHDFFPLLRKFSISRLGALKNAGPFAKELQTGVVQELLETAAREQWQLMVFVGNQGAIQIYTGEVQKIVAIPGWINVMDPDFNLHIKTTAIASAWLVKKPTVDGLVHSLEVFDAAGELLVQFFGKRKPGMPESEQWRRGIIKTSDRC